METKQGVQELKSERVQEELMAEEPSSINQPQPRVAIGLQEVRIVITVQAV